MKRKRSSTPAATSVAADAPLAPPDAPPHDSGLGAETGRVPRSSGPGPGPGSESGLAEPRLPRPAAPARHDSGRARYRSRTPRGPGPPRDPSVRGRTMVALDSARRRLLDDRARPALPSKDQALSLSHRPRKRETQDTHPAPEERPTAPGPRARAGPHLSRAHSQRPRHPAVWAEVGGLTLGTERGPRLLPASP